MSSRGNDVGEPSQSSKVSTFILLERHKPALSCQAAPSPRKARDMEEALGREEPFTVCSYPVFLSVSKASTLEDSALALDSLDLQRPLKAHWRLQWLLWKT
ncbi:rCG59539 [Rattus norvegicus]|uniref:RCG59539 n=1 Tax=Rattus norvegicus TaxID=10116 RepID=A6HR36_RAT|nr:rCG59539 [Rattus norvegicus]